MMAIIAAPQGAVPSNFTLSFTRFDTEVHYDTMPRPNVVLCGRQPAAQPVVWRQMAVDVAPETVE